jgi:Ran-binding protein 3
MAGSLDKHETSAEPSSTVGSKETTMPAPTSPTRSDKSSDSEGKPVREKLKETRIDAQTTSDPVSGSDQPMDGVPNGSAKAGDSASGSDNERGRLRRKRSREDFENDTEGEKHPEKKQEKEERHHTRKRSRDVKDIESGFPLKPTINAVAPIPENDTDEQMTSLSQEPPEATTSTANAGTDTSVKTKRTRDQVEEGTDTNHDGPATDVITNGKTTLKANVERETKRLRDEDAAQATTDAPEVRTKVCHINHDARCGSNSIDRFHPQAALQILLQHLRSPP